MTEAAPAPSPPQAPGRCPVLWVEDDPVLSDWVAQSLQDEGWPVLVAHDRSRALQLLEREVPKGQACVALLDMGLPPRPSRPDEGLLLLSQLVAQWPVLHAIVLTGQHEKAVGQQAVHAGAFDFLTKPVTAAVLRQQELWAQGRLHLSVSAQLSEGVREASDQVAEQLIRHVLGCNGFNVAAAARALGLEREQLYYHMKKFGIQRQAMPEADPGTTA